jgi:hypothetical protein
LGFKAKEIPVIRDSENAFLGSLLAIVEEQKRSDTRERLKVRIIS